MGSEAVSGLSGGISGFLRAVGSPQIDDRGSPRGRGRAKCDRAEGQCRRRQGTPLVIDGTFDRHRVRVRPTSGTLRGHACRWDSGVRRCTSATSEPTRGRPRTRPRDRYSRTRRAAFRASGSSAGAVMARTRRRLPTGFGDPARAGRPEWAHRPPSSRSSLPLLTLCPREPPDHE